MNSLRPIDKLICYKKIYSLLDDSKCKEKLFYRKDLQTSILVELDSDLFSDNFLTISIFIDNIDLNDNILQLCRLIHQWFWKNDILVEQTGNKFIIPNKSLKKVFDLSNDVILDKLEMSWLNVLNFSNSFQKNATTSPVFLKNKKTENEFSRSTVSRTPTKNPIKGKNKKG